MRARQSKSNLIRDYVANHPTAGPTAIASALAKQGTTVSPSHVASSLRFNGRRDLAQSTEETIAVLFEVKRLAHEHGLDRVRWAVAALERLDRNLGTTPLSSHRAKRKVNQRCPGAPVGPGAPV